VTHVPPGPSVGRVHQLQKKGQSGRIEGDVDQEIDDLVDDGVARKQLQTLEAGQESGAHHQRRGQCVEDQRGSEDEHAVGQVLADPDLMRRAERKLSHPGHLGHVEQEQDQEVGVDQDVDIRRAEAHDHEGVDEEDEAEVGSGNGHDEARPDPVNLPEPVEAVNNAETSEDDDDDELQDLGVGREVTVEIVGVADDLVDVGLEVVKRQQVGEVPVEGTTRILLLESDVET